jgi:mRNA-degrading endonuclease RelE of RelBE toxin-antitoxin system
LSSCIADREHTCLLRGAYRKLQVRVFVIDIGNCICNPIDVFSIEIGRSALEEIGALRAFDGRKILSAIEEELSHEPTRATRRRKILPGLKPQFEAVPPVWELRVGEYRVFYDVSKEEKKVYVRAVRRKPPHKTTEEIL